ncbi:artemin isoform X1 [Trichechus manatus latirostris]|uniref:Artemin n=1 Tax=Trichechus manatus latirostris TaxID=127582 RepID=A0A2Y9DCM7_TRIMA|nr:artemin isoform X1 [Trichechus manatus latirostris]
MEPGLGGPSVLPHCPKTRQQALLCPSAQSPVWPTLAALALLSSVAETSLGPVSRSPATREGAAPVLAPRAGNLQGGRMAHLCGGRARRTPPPPPRPAPSPSAPSRGGRAPRAGGRGNRANQGSRARAAGTRGCRLRTQLVPVRALGLGYSSDELVRFRFCSGSCRRARSPHDLSLASLLRAGVLRLPPGSRPVSQPCCRPTSYEAVSFMDVNSTWRTVERLSATACGCLG